MELEAVEAWETEWFSLALHRLYTALMFLFYDDPVS